MPVSVLHEQKNQTDDDKKCWRAKAKLFLLDDAICAYIELRDLNLRYKKIELLFITLKN